MTSELKYVPLLIVLVYITQHFEFEALTELAHIFARGMGLIFLLNLHRSQIHWETNLRSQLATLHGHGITVNDPTNMWALLRVFIESASNNYVTNRPLDQSNSHTNLTYKVEQFATLQEMALAKYDKESNSP